MMRIFYLVILGLALGQNAFSRDSYYDEVFDSSGKLRPQYEGIYQKKTKAERDEFYKKSVQAYRGDNGLNDLPLILTAEEYDTVIAPGVEQRARAILAFLADDYSGVKSYRKIVSEKVIDKIRERSGEMGYRGIVSPKNISYFYGPDLMRNSKGQNVVLEDNAGAVGLAFDLRLAHEFMLQNNPEILNHMKPRDPEDFYRELANYYKAQAEKRGGKAVLLASPERIDNEDRRIREIFSDYGIEVVYPSGRDLKLIALDHGVYTQSKSKGMRSLEKVGFVIMVGELRWYDNSHPAARERMIIEEALALYPDKDLPLSTRRKLKELVFQPYSKAQVEELAEVLEAYNPDIFQPAPFPGLVNALLSGTVGTNITPGTEFVSDKEFYIYVEDFIRFYLHEEPILKNQPTWIFANAAGELRESVFNRCFDNFSEYVIKPVDGRGGEGVYVGPNTKASLIPKLKAMVGANPEGWLCQEYVAPSRLGDLIIDRRAIANAFLEKGKFSSVTSNVSASRGNSPRGSGTVNLSRNGRAITVLIPCEKLLTQPTTHPRRRS